MDERRFLVFILLSLAIILGWPFLFPRPVEPPAAPSGEGPVRAGHRPAAGPGPVAPAVGGAVQVVAGTDGPDVVEVSCDGVRIRIDARGAQASEARVLRREEDFVRADEDLLRRLPGVPGLGAVRLDGKGEERRYLDTASARWTMAGGGSWAAASLSFADGVRIEKRFERTDDPHVIRITLAVHNGGADPRGLTGVWWGPAGFVGGAAQPAGATNGGAEPLAVTYVGTGTAGRGQVVRHDADSGDLEDGPARFGTDVARYDWCGLSGPYFAAAWRPVVEEEDRGDGAPSAPPPLALEGRLLAEHDTDAPTPVPASARTACAAPFSADLPPGGAVTYTMDVFLGPKAPGVLARHGLLARFEHEGWLMGPIERLLLWLLGWLGGWTGSYGVGIVLLTMLVRLSILPLSIKQSQAIYGMQERHRKMQPRLLELRKQYADQPKKRQQEELRLMREAGIVSGQLGGCLPILLQMPVFFALFSVLRGSIQLRGASFLWMADLTHPDAARLLGATVNVLPIVWIALMALQFKLQPAPPTSDPAVAKQQKVTQLIMFGVFGVMMYAYPSGLHLYFVTSTLWGVVESNVIRRMRGVPTAT